MLGHRARKRFGQNFLADAHYAERIVEAVAPRPGDNLVEIGPGPDVSVLTGLPIPVRAVVNLAGLSPQDVRVEAVVGRIGVHGNLEETQVMTLPAAEQAGNEYVFLKEFVPHQTGRLGYSLRISPNHYEDPLTRPCNSLLKWSAD